MGKNESPGNVTHKSTRRRPWPICDLIWFITWNGNKSTCYHYTRMNLTVDDLSIICFLMYMRENLRTALHPKRQLCWESQEYFGKGVSESRKRGVSFPGSSKVCPLFANFFWSTNVTSTIFPSSYLHIFTLSHIETKIQVSFPTSSPPLGAFSFHHHQQQPYDMSPPANQSWAPPTSLTSLKGYGHTSSNLRP